MVNNIRLASDDNASNMLGTMCSMSVSVSGAEADPSSRHSVCLHGSLAMAGADVSTSFVAQLQAKDLLVPMAADEQRLQIWPECS